MPQNGLIYRALIASPSDVAEERRLIAEEIGYWNAVNSYKTGAIIEAVLWETHARPSAGDRPQAILNKQIVEKCDFVIGAFWTRLGTPTGDAESGTAEEIEQFRAAGKHVLLYFSSVPVIPESIDSEQYAALRAYRDELGNEALYWKYQTTHEFRSLLQRHIASAMIELLEKTNAPSPDPVRTEDIRATKRAAVQGFRSDYLSFLRKLQTEWRAERDSNPRGIDEAKYILRSAAHDVVGFRSMIEYDTAGMSDLFDDALITLRQLDRHDLYQDGGESFREFFSGGDAVISELAKIPDLLDTITYDSESEVAAPPEGLSEHAITLLCEAARDRWGKILYSKSVDEPSVSANGRSFVAASDPKSESRYNLAINQLETLGYISAPSDKREVFFVTEKGYRLAESLG